MIGEERLPGRKKQCMRRPGFLELKKGILLFCVSLRSKQEIAGTLKLSISAWVYFQK